MPALDSRDSNTVGKTSGTVYRSVEEAVEHRRCNRFHRVSYLLM